MTERLHQTARRHWAHFRFSVVGPLLSSPPKRGELKAALDCLAERVWKHPIDGREVQIAATTIERRYYAARKERQDPVTAQQRNVRKDAGRVT